MSASSRLAIQNRKHSSAPPHCILTSTLSSDVWTFVHPTALDSCYAVHMNPEYSTTHRTQHPLEGGDAGAGRLRKAPRHECEGRHHISGASHHHQMANLAATHPPLCHRHFRHPLHFPFASLRLCVESVRFPALSPLSSTPYPLSGVGFSVSIRKIHFFILIPARCAGFPLSIAWRGEGEPKVRKG